MDTPLILAVDIGTSSVRAALYSGGGAAGPLTQRHHGVLRPAPFMEEQEPDAVRDLVYRVIAECLATSGQLKKNVRGISFSSQMYSVFPIDADGRPLHNSILWSDGRAEQEARTLQDNGAATELYRATGCPVNSLYPLTKIIWFRQNRPDLYAAASRFVCIKDYVAFPLIGYWATDHSMASGTGMFDLERAKWSSSALSATGLDEERLPELVPGTQALPIRNSALLHEWGLPDVTPLFLGGGDGPLANIGSGASQPGRVNIDLGTSGALRAAVDKPLFDTEGRLWCYAMFPGRWAYGGIVTNVGNALQWLGTNLAASGFDAQPDAAAAQLGALAEEAPAGSDGVFCLPYFRKARSPYWDDRLRGTIFGLIASHDIRHIARAALEAIAFDLALILDIAASQTSIARPVVLTGGLSRNNVMPQLLADVLATEIETPEHCEGSLAGAAILGLHGAGLLDGYSLVNANTKARKVFIPDPQTVGLYQALRSRYAELVTIAQNVRL